MPNDSANPLAISFVPTGAGTPLAFNFADPNSPRLTVQSVDATERSTVVTESRAKMLENVSRTIAILLAAGPSMIFFGLGILLNAFVIGKTEKPTATIVLAVGFIVVGIFACIWMLSQINVRHNESPFCDHARRWQGVRPLCANAWRAFWDSRPKVNAQPHPSVPSTSAVSPQSGALPGQSAHTPLPSGG